MGCRAAGRRRPARPRAEPVRAARARQRGAALLVVAFLLVTLMAGAALATGRNVLRDLAVEADAGPAAVAAAAAESGLEWFLAWAAADPDSLRAFLATLEGLPPGTPAVPPGVPGTGWAAPDDPLQPAFSLTLCRLGAWPEPAADGPGRQAWRVTAAGHCRPRAAGTPPAATQVRELLCLAPAAGAGGAGAAGADGTGDAGADRPEDAPPWSLRVLARRPVRGGVP